MLTFGSPIFLAFLLLVYRLVNALSIKTFFQPDEYFQSLEPAWQWAFGESSKAWITWEWHEHLRSSIHPLLFAAVYSKAAQVSDLINATPDLRADILVAAPKALQSIFAATTDFFTYMLAIQVYGSNTPASLATLFLTVLSPWQWFASVRTLSNSSETTLTVVAVCLWPWKWFLDIQEGTTTQNGHPPSDDSKAEETPKRTEEIPAKAQLHVSLGLAALACILRPTNLLVWATISVTLLLRRSNFQKLLALVQAATISGSTVLAISVATDRQFYGEWVFPPLRFVYFNVVQSLAVFYGQNRADYYLTEGLALLLTTALPFATLGIWDALRLDKTEAESQAATQKSIRFALASAIITSVIVLSLISHKEVRFIYPLLPMLLVLAAKPLSTFLHPFPFTSSKLKSALIWIGLALNSGIAYYTGYVHQRGVVDVVHYIRHEYENKPAAATVDEMGRLASPHMTVGFLMPCHSTPWRSHLVYPEIDAWALTCEPPLHLSVEERANYLDEADVFYASPEAWIDENMKDRRTIIGKREDSRLDGMRDNKQGDWPQYLVFFQHLEPTLERMLKGSKYETCWRGFNTHWHDDWRRQGDVVVWCLQ